jgi:tetrahydromethanopterin S-methyltransferase subunit G
MAREDWTDARIDDFKENVNQRFDQVDKRFDQVDKRLDQVDKRLDRIEGDIKELRQTMIQGFFVLVGINATSTLTLIGLQVL